MIELGNYELLIGILLPWMCSLVSVCISVFLRKVSWRILFLLVPILTMITTAARYYAEQVKTGNLESSGWLTAALVIYVFGVLVVYLVFLVLVTATVVYHLPKRMQKGIGMGAAIIGCVISQLSLLAGIGYLLWFLYGFIVVMNQVG